MTSDQALARATELRKNFVTRSNRLHADNALPWLFFAVTRHDNPRAFQTVRFPGIILHRFGIAPTANLLVLTPGLLSRVPVKQVGEDFLPRFDHVISGELPLVDPAGGTADYLNFAGLAEAQLDLV